MCRCEIYRSAKYIQKFRPKQADYRYTTPQHMHKANHSVAHAHHVEVVTLLC